MLGIESQGLRPLGVGLTYFAALASFFQERADLIEVVEVSPETLWVEDGRGGYVCDQAEMARLAEFPAPKVIHGVSNPVGGSAHGGYWLDAHSGAIPDAVFGFARELAGSLPNLRVVNFEFMPLYFAQFGADGVVRQLFALTEAEAFAAYLAGLDLEVPHLRSVVSFELAVQHAAARGDSATIEFDGDPNDILSRLARGLRPPPPAAEPQPVVVEPREAEAEEVLRSAEFGVESGLT